MNAFLAILLFIIPIFFLIFKRKAQTNKKLPPGSLGLPFIGQSLTLLRVMRANTAEKWLEERVKKYGDVSKLSLFGKPTVFIHGQAANKLVFASESGTMSNQQVTSIRMIMGERNLLELSGDDHKRVRAALVSFLKPECLKQYVGKIEDEIKRHLDIHWQDKDQVTVLPLMKTLTFNIICSLLFGIEFGTRRDELITCFQTMIVGMWSVPINLPFTRYNKSLRATTRVREIVRELIREKDEELKKNGNACNQDLITCLLSIRGEDGKREISEDEIVHNIVLVMVAGHDTSSVVITFLVRLLANEPSILEGVVQEQEQIAKNKAKGESLTWEDLAMMKYTWRVANETLRVFPPVFGGFRTTQKDIEFGGYVIPQGWQLREAAVGHTSHSPIIVWFCVGLTAASHIYVWISMEVFWVTSMTHMDGSIFKEPSKFDPTRFENQAAIPPYCFIPFGGGARICPGYEFARIEILVALHYLITQFTWKLCCKDDKFSRDPMPVPTQGLPIQLYPKN